MFVQLLLESYEDNEMSVHMVSSVRIKNRILRTFNKEIKVLNVPPQGNFFVATNANLAVISEQCKDSEIVQRAAQQKGR